MRSIVTVLSIAAIVLGSLYDDNYFARPNEIEWSDSVTIAWNNFKGLALPLSTPRLQTQLNESEKIRFWAQTVTDIICNEEDGEYYVKSIFYPGRSFYVGDLDEMHQFPETLKHELYHFHITELQARYLRRDILDHMKRSKKVNINELLAKCKRELDSLSKSYDRITRHGVDKSNQKIFERTIDSLLFEAKRYASLSPSRRQTKTE